jgi:hypothetical protein
MESTQQIFFGSQTSGNSASFATGRSDYQFIDIVLQTTAADAVCSFTIQSSAEPATSWAVDTAALPQSVLPAGFSFANGVLSVASPAIGTYRVRLVLQTGPYLRVAYSYTSGAVASARVVVFAHN